jgi:ABC-type multidrug transport system permease subunit
VSATPVEVVEASTGEPTAEGHVAAVAMQLARRAMVGMLRVPATVIPVIVMPLFFTVAFSGAFTAITDLPAFPTDEVLNWMAPFAILQGAAFAGLGASFGAGRDLENGFYDRLLVAPVPRRALLLGPLLFSATRSLIPVVIVVPVALLAGATLIDPLGLLTLLAAAVGVAVVSGLWGLGVAYRTRTQRSGALTQVGIFMAMFLATGQVPLEVMDGWLRRVAGVNPVTEVLALARQGFLGDVTWADTWPGLLALVVAALGLGLFAWRGFRRLVP